MITGAGATLLVGMGAFDIDEIITARLETKSICCRLACERRGHADLDAMRKEIAFQRTAAISDEEFCASDVRFHRAVVEAAGNGPLNLMMYTVIESFMPDHQHDCLAGARASHRRGFPRAHCRRD